MKMAEALEVLRRAQLMAQAQEICDTHGSSLSDVFGESRLTHHSRARRHVALLVKTRLGWSLPAIGGLMNRDHTSILAMVRKAKLELKTLAKEKKINEDAEAEARAKQAELRNAG